MKKAKAWKIAAAVCALLAIALMGALVWMASAPAAFAEGAAPAQMIDLTGLFNALLALLGALVTYRLIPWLKARTSESQQEAMKACAKTLVYAAEQLYRTGNIQDRLLYVQEEMERRGYTADRDAIEAAVTELRRDMCAYLEDFSVTEVKTYESETSVDPSEAQNPAAVPAHTATKAAGAGNDARSAGEEGAGTDGKKG